MRKFLIIGGVVAALAAGILAIGIAGAEEGARPGGRFIAKVAEKLGITEDELTTAMTDAQLEIIDESVTDGTLTEEQADKLRERVEEYGPLSILRGPGHHRQCRGAHFVGGAAATVLGMEPEELAELVQSGQSLATVAESQGMSVDDFKTALLAEVKVDLDAKVADGSTTQERADKAYEMLETNIDRVVNFVPSEDGPRPCRPHGGPPPEEAPATTDS